MSQKIYSWFDEPDNVVIYLDPNILSNFVRSVLGPSRHSSLAKKIITFSHTSGVSVTQIKRWLYGYTNGGIEVRNLKKLCKFLGTPLVNLNKEIKAIGQPGKKSSFMSVERPKLPFNLYQPSIGTIIGAQTGDASLNPRMWTYYNTDFEMLIFVNNAVKTIFGNVRPTPLFDRNRNLYGFQYPPTVARALCFLGMKPGIKTKLNPPLPSIVLKGNRSIKKEYLKQRFSDEGSCHLYSVIRKRITIACYQGIDLTSPLKKINLFNQVRKSFANKGKVQYIEPSNVKFSRITSIQSLPKRVLSLIQENSPKWLEADRFILSKTFGIKASTRPRDLRYFYKTKRIVCGWLNMITNKRSILKFYRNIGFVQTWKMGKLHHYVKEIIGGSKIEQSQEQITGQTRQIADRLGRIPYACSHEN